MEKQFRSQGAEPGKSLIESLGMAAMLRDFKSYVFFLVPLMAEIRRSPVEVGSLFHNLQGFLHPRWCRISAINSMSVKNMTESLI